MSERVSQRVASISEDAVLPPSSERLGEERARQILERAAALDAKRSSEVEVAQLREAAAAAGISPEAFDQAMREEADSASDGPPAAHPTGPLRSPGAAEVAHYAGLLKDLLGEDANILVVEDRIEGRNEEGVTVSINPASGEATAAIVAAGSLRRRLLALTAPATVPAFLAFLLAVEEGDPGLGMMLGVVLAVAASAGGTVLSFLRERKSLRRRSERIRRQLQRMLAPGPNQQ